MTRSFIYDKILSVSILSSKYVVDAVDGLVVPCHDDGGARDVDGVDGHRLRGQQRPAIHAALHSLVAEPGDGREVGGWKGEKIA